MSTKIVGLLFCVISIVYGFDFNPSKETDYNARLLKLENRLEEQNKVIRHQSQRIQTLEGTDKELRNIFRNTVNDMNAKTARQENEITRLRKQVMTLTRREQKTRRTLSSLQEVVDQMKIDNQEPVRGVNLSNKTNTKKKEVNDERRPKGPISENIVQGDIPNTSKPTVAFYAYMSSVEKSPSLHHPLIFDVEKVDIGGGYNPYTGSFIVPVDGVYMFSYSVRVYCHAKKSVEIVKNGNVEGSITADSTVSCDNDMTTGIAVVTVAKGDVVFVRTHSIHLGNGDIYNNENGRCSFSGGLIG